MIRITMAISTATLVWFTAALSPVAAMAADNGQVVRFARVKVAGKTSYALVEGKQIRLIEGTPFGRWHRTEKLYPLEGVQILVPTRPSKVLALAGNYLSHLGDKPAPPHPEPFIKLPSCLQRHGGPIIQPKDTEPVHYEAELVIVIGKRAKKVSKRDALKYVLGVTCGNDVSARAWQQNDVQWWRAKATDTFGPCGPFIACGLDYNNLELVLRVNGKVKQRANTRDMIHDVPTVVSFISRYVTLEPGDLIFTGTPGTTEALRPGDVVEVEIEGVGVLRNHVVAEQ
jgi:2-keto-4-pentenoate hydratase/2-oxohepta-3-ene-1,7-dioic acid hydratase in catechol pathway